MWKRTPLGAASGLAGCEGEDARAEPPEAKAELPVRSSPAATGETAVGSLPPATVEPRFIGRWAANAELCGNAAWRFSSREMVTPAGSVCRFGEVKTVPGGYDIAARCTAEGPETGDNIRLRFAESARAMLFEAESIADSGLIYCGPVRPSTSLGTNEV